MPSPGRDPRGRWPQLVAPFALPLALALGLLLACAATASAQSKPGPLPPGPGRVAGRIVHPDGPATIAGVPVALYGLSATGEAGVADTTTDEAGVFAFEGVSNDPGTAYLVGARYREIPFFGPRVTFEEGQTETHVIIDVREPTTDASGIEIAEVIVQFEWVADRLAIQETHRVSNSGGSVVLIDEAERAGRDAPFEARLPEGAADFAPAFSGFEDGVEQHDRVIRFWGPLYPGGQDLRFQYTLPLSDGSGESAERPPTAISLSLPMGAGGLSVLTGAGGPEVVEPGELGDSAEIELEGRPFRVRRIAEVAPGARIDFAIALPETSSDASRIQLERADAWVEYDDTLLSVDLQMQFVVAGHERIASRGREPLLRIPLPEGSELVALGGMAEGPAAREVDGAVELYGPLPPGAVPVSVRYRLAPTPDGASFDLRFPLELKALNVLVADTGIAIESDRLHRRRPFRQGTRIYLHREAFNVRADETVRVGLRPLEPSGLGNRTSLGVTFATVVGAALFLAQPLLRRKQMVIDPEQTAHSIRREALYEAIRDLDHDLETGKLAPEDHTEMRETLRAQAVELLRRERGEAAADTAGSTGRPSKTDSTDSTGDAACPGCGIATQASWAFCSGCGRQLGVSA